MKKIIGLFLSLKAMGAVLILLAVSMAIATFVESSFGTPTAHYYIYDAHWFEFLFILFAINLISNILRDRLFSKEKLPLGLIHIAFLIIIVGAAITRYFGINGTLHIRESETTDFVLSDKTYFGAELNSSGSKQIKEKEFYLSPYAPRQINFTFHSPNGDVRIKSLDFMSDAVQTIVPDSAGSSFLELIVGTQKGMKNVVCHPDTNHHYVPDSQAQELPPVVITTSGDNILLTAPDTLHALNMVTLQHDRFAPLQTIVANPRLLYSSGNTPFLIKSLIRNGKIDYIPSEVSGDGQKVIVVEVSMGRYKSEVKIPANGQKVKIGNSEVRMWFGKKKIPLPFRVQLNDFRVQRYAGSQSPSSYISDIRLIDSQDRLLKSSSVFMNNALKYEGYRFCQSSSDEDEKGSVLSVNRDGVGVLLTYLGYFLLFIGIVGALVSPYGYFRKLFKRMNSFTSKTFVVIVFLFVGVNHSFASDLPEVNSKLAKQFGRLWVQGNDGRAKPVSTLSRELLSKLARSESYQGLSADQVVLSMMINPGVWQKENLLKIDRELAVGLGVSAPYVSYSALFNEKGEYVLAEAVREAHSKDPALRTLYDKDIITLDEKVSVANMIFNGSLFQIFPAEENNNTWLCPGKLPNNQKASEYHKMMGVFVRFLIAANEGDNQNALTLLDEISTFQRKYGELPSDSHLNAE
ncbi:MAG: cytochrome c biogenesis protein ResB [Bacteroidota bacterium]|nr:cytochrome c biogenesis protein ResB [Bacteroidota bacterium]